MNNPWDNLPLKPLYILPDDRELIEKHRNYSNLRLDTVPDQVAGGLNNAEVVFLALNPGFDERDVSLNLKLPGFVDDNRKNLTDPYNSPFYHLNEDYKQTGGYQWWSKKLKPLVLAGIPEVSLRQKIMLIEYFPYHSTRYKHITPLVPSQRYAFGLVREAIERSKIIIIMRSKRLWLEAVPGLETYEHVMTLHSPQNVIISPKNLGEDNFEIIRARLANDKSCILNTKGTA